MDFFTSAAFYLIASLLVFVSVVIFLVNNNLYAMDVWMKFPLIGTMTRKLAKNPSKGQDGWFASEKELCGQYHKFIHFKDRFDFEQQREHMRLAGDSGRTATPFFIWGILAILLVAESYGFSLLLGDLMVGESGTAQQTVMAAIGTVVVLATILLILTHAAGHTTSVVLQRKACFAEALMQGTPARSDTVDLAKHQDVDKDKPDYVRRLNRIADVGTKGSLVPAVILWTLIVVIAIGMVYVRYSQLEDQKTQNVDMGQVVDPFSDAADLPPDVINPQIDASNKAKEESLNLKKSGNLTAYIILSIIFLLTQGLGFFFGFKYGFFSLSSKKYDKLVVKFPTYERYQEYIRPRINLASQRLTELQNLLPKADFGNSDDKNTKRKDFIDFSREQNDLEKNNDPKRSTSDAPVLNITPETVPGAVVKPKQLGIDEVKDTMMSINDAAKEKEYFMSLDSSVKADPGLQLWLKQRKEEREKATRGIDVNDLF